MRVHMSAVHLQEPISDLSDATVVQQFHKKFLDVFHLHCRRKKSFCISLCLSSYPFSIFTFSQAFTTCENSGDPFSGCRFLVQAAWAAWCASHTALLSASPRPWSISSPWVVVVSPLCTPHSAVHGHKPRSEWVWALLGVNLEISSEEHTWAWY